MPQTHVRVMIVDDHDMVRNGLVVLLEAFSDLSLVGSAKNGQEAVELCDRNEVDVVLMDLVMPEMDGIATTRALRQRHPHVRVVALVSFGEEELLEEVIKAGAASYVFKNARIDHVAETIRAVAARGSAPWPDTAPRATSLASRSHEPDGVQS